MTIAFLIFFSLSLPVHGGIWTLLREQRIKGSGFPSNAFATTVIIDRKKIGQRLGSDLALAFFLCFPPAQAAFAFCSFA